MIIYKGKGVLVPIFLTVSVLVTAVAFGELKRNTVLFGSTDISAKYILGIGCILAGLWTWYAKDTYITKDGKKIILHDEENSLYFIKMKYWSHLFFLIGIVLTLSKAITYFQ